MPSEPMTIAGLSESLPPAKISVSAATAHGGGFSSLFLVIFFVHSTGILRRIGTKHEISVRKSRENPLEKTLSIVIRFVVQWLIHVVMTKKSWCL
jgi:hypothetical protein